MVIADLHPETPITVAKSDLPFRIQGIRNAGGPALGEPVEIRMTEVQVKWLIQRLATELESR